MSENEHLNHQNQDEMTREQLIAEGGRWLLAQGVSTVLLGCILAFMAYDKVKLQPSRDQIQRDAYKELQLQSQEFFDSAIERIEKHNELWRQAVLGRAGASMQLDIKGNGFPYSDTLSVN